MWLVSLTKKGNEESSIQNSNMLDDSHTHRFPRSLFPLSISHFFLTMSRGCASNTHDNIKNFIIMFMHSPKHPPPVEELNSSTVYRPSFLFFNSHWKTVWLLTAALPSFTHLTLHLLIFFLNYNKQ